MLSDALKDAIRGAYNAIIADRSLVPRWGQRQMIAEIANTLARIPAADAAVPDAPPICVIEAGTGTGKTIAYSVAAIPVAQSLGKRLVVATATVALQEQFINKDLPDIRRGSGLQFSYALAKGRRRYLCLSKLDRLMVDEAPGADLLPFYTDDGEGCSDEDAMTCYQAMLDALGRGQWDGDRDNWPQSIPEPLWRRLTVDFSECTGRRCPNIAQCSFFRARDALHAADIVVTNHDLVLADFALGGGAILPPPEDCIYIFDEGHHLPDKALSHFASFCRLHSTAAWLRESKRVLESTARRLDELAGGATPPGLPETIDDTVTALSVAEREVAELFDAPAVADAAGDRQLRFEHGVVPEALRGTAMTLQGLFEQLVSALGRIETALQRALDDDLAVTERAQTETLHMGIGGMLSRAEAALALWRDFAAAGKVTVPPHARWATLLQNGGQRAFDLHSSPILADDILTRCLWDRAAGVVVTSATLTALGSFERFILRTGAPREANYKVVASPFRYDNAVLRIPRMDCDPSDAQAHTALLLEQLPQVIDPLEGTLVLFSSRRQMLDVYRGLDGLEPAVLLQDDYSKQELLRRHRASIDSGGGSVIFGLASYAEGVDLPGAYCRHVVIAKIPFAVPDSPLEAALAEWFEACGRNPFMELSVPDAALRLVQASGRLLRTEEDTGRVTLLDRRILTRRYGRAILDSLPPFRRELETG